MGSQRGSATEPKLESNSERNREPDKQPGPGGRLAPGFRSRRAAKRWTESRWPGVLEATLVMLLFVGFGLAWAGALERAAAPRSAYPEQPMEAPSETPAVWLLDGFNVLQVGLLGGRDRSSWWTGGPRDALLDLADRFDDPAAEIWVVFDGPRDVEASSRDDAGVGAARLRQVFAPSADDWLLARVRSADDPGRIVVVTADRKVADRARHRGARVFTPRAFLERCTG